VNAVATLSRDEDCPESKAISEPMHIILDRDECYYMYKSGVPCLECHGPSVFRYTAGCCVIECPSCGDIDLSDALPFDPNAMVRSLREKAGIKPSEGQSQFVEINKWPPTSPGRSSSGSSFDGRSC
jgi:hypothetical protein